MEDKRSSRIADERQVAPHPHSAPSSPEQYHRLTTHLLGIDGAGMPSEPIEKGHTVLTNSRVISIASSYLVQAPTVPRLHCER